MSIEVSMPKLADTLVEGTLARWLKAAHETVQKGEPLAEIETDKVTTELSAPTGGTLGELLIEEGETVPVGTLLARIYTSGEQPVHQQTPEVEQQSVLAPAAPRASRLATRIARDHGVDLTQIEASGRRITRSDIERHLEHAVSPSVTTAVPSQQHSAQLDRSARKPVGSSLPGDEMLPLTGLRRSIAIRMAEVHKIPTGHAVVEADVTELERFYKRERDEWMVREGFPLTYTPFFLRAQAQSLSTHAEARQAWQKNRSIPRQEVHIGVAVALEDGLIVPVIRHADQQDLLTLARTLTDLATRARARHLKPDEVTGGIATLTNIGSMAGLLAFPLLNENQALILGIGAITHRAVRSDEGIAYRACAYLSLTFDRRLLNDLQAERFLQDVTRNVAHAPSSIRIA